MLIISHRLYRCCSYTVRVNCFYIFKLHHVFLLPLSLLFFHRLVLSTFSRMNTNSSDEFFQATNHAEQTFRKMETYLQHKQLCDVLLIAGDHKIPAHRLVFVPLSALISLITYCFRSELKRSSSGCTSLR